MYEEHPEFTPPPPDAVLWRYMDFTKFVSLLDREALFFARADKLGDPFEGSVSTVNKAMRPTWLLDQGVPSDEISELVQMISNSKRQSGRMVLVNCWHENNYESEAMWKLYAKDAGVAIKTTFRDLSDSFKGKDTICIGRIDYIDYASTPIGERSLFTSFLNKRRSFQHEHEVRAMSLFFAPDYTHIGKYIEVDISSLVGEVVGAPYVRDWFLELVRAVSSRYGLQAPVVKSSLSAEPIW